MGSNIFASFKPVPKLPISSMLGSIPSRPKAPPAPLGVGIAGPPGSGTPSTPDLTPNFTDPPHIGGINSDPDYWIGRESNYTPGTRNAVTGVYVDENGIYRQGPTDAEQRAAEEEAAAGGGGGSGGGGTTDEDGNPVYNDIVVPAGEISDVWDDPSLQYDNPYFEDIMKIFATQEGELDWDPIEREVLRKGAIGNRAMGAVNAAAGRGLGGAFIMGQAQADVETTGALSEAHQGYISKLIDIQNNVAKFLADESTLKNKYGIEAATNEAQAITDAIQSILQSTLDAQVAAASSEPTYENVEDNYGTGTNIDTSTGSIHTASGVVIAPNPSAVINDAMEIITDAKSLGTAITPGDKELYAFFNVYGGTDVYMNGMLQATKTAIKDWLEKNAGTINKSSKYKVVYQLYNVIRQSFIDFIKSQGFNFQDQAMSDWYVEIASEYGEVLLRPYQDKIIGDFGGSGSSFDAPAYGSSEWGAGGY